MIDVSSVVTDPEFAQQFVIERPTGNFVNEGAYVKGEPILIDRVGTIVSGVSKDVIDLLPEGTRVNNTISVFSDKDIFLGDGETMLPDVVLWRGGRYKVIYSDPFSDFGFWYVIAEGQTSA